MRCLRNLYTVLSPLLLPNSTSLRWCNLVPRLERPWKRGCRWNEVSVKKSLLHGDFLGSVSWIFLFVTSKIFLRLCTASANVQEIILPYRQMRNQTSNKALKSLMKDDVLGAIPGSHYLNQTDCTADATAKGLFIWANISTSTTSLLQGQRYNEED